MGRPKAFDEQTAVGEAMELFWEKGYRATTPAELGDALGIGRGSLYHAFGSKHALYRRALEQYVADQRRQFMEAFDTDGSMSDRIRRGLSVILDGAPQPRGCMVTTVAIEAPPDDEETTAFARAVLAEQRTFLRAAIEDGRLLAKGLPAGPGAATGKVVFFADEAEALAAKGETNLILCRHETSPEDIRGMNASLGFMTAFGGMTSHAALVARQMGKVCIVGCDALSFDYHARQMKVETANGEIIVKEGDWISIDGFAGEVINGRVDTTPSEVIRVLIEKNLDPKQAPIYQTYAKLMSWADGARRLRVRANADQPDQSEAAVAFGAEGIGLCRTEHMFFGEGKIGPMREMIVAETEEARRAALDKLLPLQREDFAGIFRAMKGRPVTIRTLDPPLHEFLPHDDAGVAELARDTGKTVEAVKERIHDLKESNPMLGHRGCRLGITYPEITEMQARAVFEAAVDVAKEGIEVFPEIMIPLVGTKKELDLQAAIVRKAAADVFAARGKKVGYLVGTMIEIPRAALTADQIAETAEFFSFGTNDLTQMTFGLSRDDVPRVLAAYQAQDIYQVDPFVSVDRQGVGALMKIAAEKGRSVKQKLKLGICGEHGGDPASVEFCNEIGLDYVSCSPYRLPIARLAAAQAALKQ